MHAEMIRDEHVVALARWGSHTVDHSVVMHAPTDATCDRLAEGINPRRLILADGFITDAGARSLARSISSWTRLAYLDVSGNDISSEGIKLIARALPDHVIFDRDNDGPVDVDLIEDLPVAAEMVDAFLAELLELAEDHLNLLLRRAGLDHQRVIPALHTEDTRAAYADWGRALRVVREPSWSTAPTGTTEHTLHVLFSDLIQALESLTAINGWGLQEVRLLSEELTRWAGTAAAWRGDGREQICVDRRLACRLSWRAEVLRSAVGDFPAA